MLSVKCLGWAPPEWLLDENLGQRFPTGRSDKTGPWLKAEGGLGFPVPKALHTGPRGRPSLSQVFTIEDTTKSTGTTNSLHHHPQPPALPRTPSLSDWSTGGSESTPDAVTTFEIWKWVTRYKRTQVEDNEQECNLEICHRLLARHLSGFQRRKTFQEYVHFCVF